MQALAKRWFQKNERRRISMQRSARAYSCQSRKVALGGLRLVKSSSLKDLDELWERESSAAPEHIADPLGFAKCRIQCWKVWKRRTVGCSRAPPPSQCGAGFLPLCGKARGSETKPCHSPPSCSCKSYASCFSHHPGPFATRRCVLPAHCISFQWTNLTVLALSLALAAPEP